MSRTGRPDSRLVVLRGNSGSGKTSTARELRNRLGRGIAWVEQDHLRRVVLYEHDVAGGINIGLIDQTVRYALDHGYDVVLEGIFHAAHYETMLARLNADHAGTTAHYYFDISLEETLRRHASKPVAKKVTADQLREWYRTRDLLGYTAEEIIGETSTLDATASRIISDLGWVQGPPVPHTLDLVM